ncbi:Myb family transcription factor PHL8 [Linum perenne]
MDSSNQNMNLVLSTDAKPRLKWTAELHTRFIDAVNRLGGPEKATPKSLMRVMGIPGLTLYHLKSHLQKYRLGKSQQSLTSIEAKQEILFDAESEQIQRSDSRSSREICNEIGKPIKESLQIAQALQVQMEVQRKLHEQIEVQRHLQLRIEAQGKYLQSVLNKAQETLAGYGSSSVGIELAKAELSKLVSMVNSGCTSSCISDLSETDAGSSRDRKPNKTTVCSVESSLTSSESSDGKYEQNETTDTNGSNEVCVELNLMDVHPRDNNQSNRGTSSNHGKKKKRNGKIVEQPMAKRFRSSEQHKESEMLITTFDLNMEYENDTNEEQST